MSERLIAIIQELSQEKNLLDAHRTKLSEQLDAVERKAIQIQEALVALGQKPKTKSGKKANGRPAKSAAKKDDVITALSEILQSSGELSESRANALVEEKIVSSGKSRTGLALRFGEATKNAQFEKSNGRIRLVSNSHSIP